MVTAGLPAAELDDPGAYAKGPAAGSYTVAATDNLTAIGRHVGVTVTDPSNPGYVAAPERIAIFDNDGTLWVRANGFKTFIVSGGGIEFMRPMTEQVYGIPPEQVVGSTIKTQYQVQNGKPVLIRQAELDFIDDKAGKPMGIHQFVGRRPIAAFGNSTGHREMLEWTSAGDGARLMMLVFHDDAERE